MFSEHTWKRASIALLQDVNECTIELRDAIVGFSLNWEQKQDSAEPKVIHAQHKTPAGCPRWPDEDKIMPIRSLQSLAGEWQRWDALFPWIFFVANQESIKKMNMSFSFSCCWDLQLFQEGSNLYG